MYSYLLALSLLALPGTSASQDLEFNNHGAALARISREERQREIISQLEEFRGGGVEVVLLLARPCADGFPSDSALFIKGFNKEAQLFVRFSALRASTEEGEAQGYQSQELSMHSMGTAVDWAQTAQGQGHFSRTLVDKIASLLTDLSFDDLLFMGHEALLSGPAAFLYTVHALCGNAGFSFPLVPVHWLAYALRAEAHTLTGVSQCSAARTSTPPWGQADASSSSCSFPALLGDDDLTSDRVCLYAGGMPFELARSAIHTPAIKEALHLRVARDAGQPVTSSCRTGTWIGVIVGALVALFISILINVYCYLRLRHAVRQPGQQQGILKFADDPFDFE
eukprot:m.237967 g.237967  ORF g.237967 m.237967 type:complete len:338 (-) comp21506_c0_seq1:29-1042(-)